MNKSSILKFIFLSLLSLTYLSCFLIPEVPKNDDNSLQSKNFQLLNYARDKGLAALAQLLAEGADILATDTQGQTALHIAAQSNPSLNVIEFLVKKGIPVNQKDALGNTPLHLAAAANSYQAVKLLFSLGAHTTAQNKQGQKPLDLANKNPKLEDIASVDLSFLNIEYNKQDNDPEKSYSTSSTNAITDEERALWQAIEDDDIDAVKTALKAGAQTEKAKSSGNDKWPALQIAAQRIQDGYASHDIVKLLLKKGAHPGVIGSLQAKAISPLHVLMGSDSKAALKAIQLLIDAGAPLDKAYSSMDSTPLYSAITANNYAAVELLIKGGARVDSIDYITQEGAILNMDLKLLKLLVANDTRSTKLGYYDVPLYYAAAHSSPEIVQYLIDQGANLDTRGANGNVPLHLAAQRLKDGLPILKVLVQAGATLDVQNDTSKTPLYFAALLHQPANVPGDIAIPNSIKMAKYLIKSGAKPKNAYNQYGWTPLHRIALTRERRRTKFLLDNGFDLSAKGNNGITVLHAAAWAAGYGSPSQQELKEILDYFKFLFKQDGIADLLNAKTNSGKTPLDYATSGDRGYEVAAHQEVQDFLKKQGALRGSQVN